MQKATELEATQATAAMDKVCHICGDICDGKRVQQTGFGINTAELGAAQSLFMLGYSGASVVFGRLVHHYAHFKLMGIGTWTAVIVCEC